MSEAITLARPYAQAAFDLARTAGTLDHWSEALAVAAQVAADERTHHLLNDPRVSRTQLLGMYLPEDAEADGLFARFFGELAHHRRLDLLPEVAELFEMLKREDEDKLKVEVSSALALETAEAEQLKVSLAKRYGRAIDMRVTVDETLLAGVVIDTGTEVIDGSARGRLERLARELTH